MQPTPPAVPTARRLLLLLALLLAASASLSHPAAATEPQLRAFPSCPRLLSFYRASALARSADFAIYTPRRARRRGGPSAASDPASPAPTSSDAAFASKEGPAADVQSASGTGFSDTNVQVAGVDEPDIVKTDGARIFIVRSRRLSLVRATPAAGNGFVVAALDLPTTVSEMILDGDTLLLIGSSYGELDPNKRPSPLPQPPFFGGPRPVATARRTVSHNSSAFLPDDARAQRSFALPPTYGEPLTVVYRVSAAAGKLRLRDTLRMHGNYVSARAVRGVVRVVTSFRPSFSFVTRTPLRRHRTRPGRDGAKRTPPSPAAVSAIRRTRLDTWLPRYRLAASCGWDRKARKPCRRVRAGFLVSCSRVYRPTGAFSGFSLLVVTTLRLRGRGLGADPGVGGGEFFARYGGTAVVSDGRDVYATADSLYVTTTVYENDMQMRPFVGIGFRTSFHKFQLLPWATRYAGSGSVSGSVLNQFAMHEQGDVFYIATTEGAPWLNRRGASRSKISAYRASRKGLRWVGAVGNLGVGERIYAVRYVGAVAYVVTFREIDPLYVVDIRNPARMRVTGELKIPGFSSFLHPLGEGRLLGVGSDVSQDGATTGVKVSLFDVSDVTRPRERAVWTLKGSFSGAQWDHRAFLYWAPEKMAVLPLDVYNEEKNEHFSGSIVLKIESGKIAVKGRIAHPKCCGRYAYQPGIERNFMLGRVNLWSFSQNALQVNDIRTLKFKSIVKLAMVWG